MESPCMRLTLILLQAGWSLDKPPGGASLRVVRFATHGFCFAEPAWSGPPRGLRIPSEPKDALLIAVAMSFGFSASLALYFLPASTYDHPTLILRPFHDHSTLILRSADSHPTVIPHSGHGIPGDCAVFSQSSKLRGWWQSVHKKINPRASSPTAHQVHVGRTVPFQTRRPTARATLRKTHGQCIICIELHADVSVGHFFLVMNAKLCHCPLPQ
jgi:hypothetical protein